MAKNMKRYYVLNICAKTIYFKATYKYVPGGYKSAPV